MVKSMTGYGRAQQTIDGMDITFEVKSVNHRNYEYSSRLPRAYGFLDDKIKKHLQRHIARGKVDVFLYIETIDAPGTTVSVNHTLAKAYLDAYHELAETYALREDVTVVQLARNPDILTVHKSAEDEEAVWSAVKVVVDEAVARFVAMRETEGERMKADVLSRRDTILEAVGVIEERSPQTVREHMDKVVTRMRELLDGAAVDEQRLLTEAAIYADKIAVAEETVRLRSHLDQLVEILSMDKSIGHDLNFLVQEINRETNTIGSKASDVTITRLVMSMKGEIEKIREQIQNIE